jgi:hypothetical protein
LTRAVQTEKSNLVRKLQENNIEILKLIRKVQDKSTCHIGLNGEVPVNELLGKFIPYLSYGVAKDEIRIIKKGFK